MSLGWCRWWLRSKREQQQAQPWSLRQEATLYAGASFDTFTGICLQRGAWSGVTFLKICDALMWLQCNILKNCAPTGSKFCTCPVLFCRNQILCNFAPISHLAAFLHKTIFLRTQLRISARGCAQKPQCITLCLWHCDFNVNNRICVCAHFEHQCAHIHNVNSYMLMTLRLLCAPRCPGELSVKGTRSLNRFSY